MEAAFKVSQKIREGIAAYGAPPQSEERQEH